MPSRKIEDCCIELETAWEFAEGIYRNLYPNDPKPILTCTYRSPEEQTKLYAQGRTAPGPKVTNAKAGESPHNLLPAEAFDIAFKKEDGSLDWNPELFKKFATIMKDCTVGIVWGGDFKSIKDAPHFETKDWKKRKK